MNRIKNIYCLNFKPPFSYRSPDFDSLLDFYEDYCGSRTNWNLLIEEINKNYLGDPERFLNTYNSFQHQIVEDIMPFKEVLDSINFSRKLYMKIESVYKKYNSGKEYIRVEINDPIFDCHRINLPGVVYGKRTFKEFLGHYGIPPFFDLDHFKSGIFGNLSTNFISDSNILFIKEINNILSPLNLDHVCNNIISTTYSLPKNVDPKLLTDEIYKRIQENTDSLDVNIKVFELIYDDGAYIESYSPGKFEIKGVSLDNFEKVYSKWRKKI